MKISEIVKEVQQPPQELKVDSDNAEETVLIDPKTKVKTVLPKKSKGPNAPAPITKDETGKLTMNKQKPGAGNQRGIKPGDTVKVQ